MLDVTKLYTLDLLALLIGSAEADALYPCSLDALFCEKLGSDDAVLKLAAARELVMRWLEERLSKDSALARPDDVRKYLRVMLAGRERESFVVLFLDSQHRLISAEEVFQGTLAQTSVYPREIVKRALAHNAGAVVLAHNHPSGVAEPSQSDQILTETLARALALVDVKVLDHFVVGDSSAMSFAERGLL